MNLRNVIYEVFVDRFAGPEGRPLGPLPSRHDPATHHCGGTLDGIAAKISHVVSTGADAICLTPIFRAPSNHKYDTASFEEIDPSFGGTEAFEKLVSRVRDKRMGLILDGVFSHVGSTHAWFEEARTLPRSRIRDYFKWIRYPDYQRWRGLADRPQLAVDHARVRIALFDGEDSVLRTWLRRGATGWRLTSANDLGLKTCGRAVEVGWEERAPDGVVGSVMAYDEEWVAKGRLDGVVNYYFRETVLGLASGKIQPEQAAYNFKRMAERYRYEALLRSWNVLSTHETPRLATEVPDHAARCFARGLAFSFPGTPHIYYGDEICMKGGAEDRAPMQWEESKWDLGTLGHVRALAGIRWKRKALREGGFLPMPQPGTPRLIAFARTTQRPEEVVIVLANAGPKPLQCRVFAPYSFLFDSLPLQDLVGICPPTKVQSGAFDVRLPGWAVAYYVPGDVPGYNFFHSSP